jgi:hypothetical protein
LKHYEKPAKDTKQRKSIEISEDQFYRFIRDNNLCSSNKNSKGGGSQQALIDNKDSTKTGGGFEGAQTPYMHQPTTTTGIQSTREIAEENSLVKKKTLGRGITLKIVPNEQPHHSLNTSEHPTVENMLSFQKSASTSKRVAHDLISTPDIMSRPKDEIEPKSHEKHLQISNASTKIKKNIEEFHSDSVLHIKDGFIKKSFSIGAENHVSVFEIDTHKKNKKMNLNVTSKNVIFDIVKVSEPSKESSSRLITEPEVSESEEYSANSSASDNNENLYGIKYC